MDITKENFASSLGRVHAAIRRSSFLAVDCEFSGLSRRVSACPYDTPEERYALLRQKTSGYIVLQFGLAAFTREEEHNRYSQETFNFYLFPRDPDQQGSFRCKPSSLEFLRDNGFDFNRLISDGIPYLRPDQVQTLRERLELRHLEDSDWTPPAADRGLAAWSTPVPNNQAEFVETAISEIRNFLETSEEYLDFHDLSRYQRVLLFDHVPSRIETPLQLETVRDYGDKRTLRVCRKAGKDQSQRRLQHRLEEAEGFGRVIRAVCQSGKPVVGHNLLQDLLHITDQFLCPLPETYAEFKSVVHHAFPILVDTKVMSLTSPFKSLIEATGLQDLAGSLAKHPFNMPDIVSAPGSGGTEYGLTDNKHHEAGYDAFLTAACFATMLSYLGLQQRPPQPMLEPTAEIVRKFANKIYAIRIEGVLYLNFKGEDAIPSRDHVLHLTFPATWKKPDIIRLFRPCRVKVTWVDDTSAFVALHRADQVSQALQNATAADQVTVCTFGDWRARQ